MLDRIVKLRVLGETAAEINGRSFRPDATHLFAALVVLALQPQHRITRQRLGTLLWPDAPGNRRAERLRWLLSKLRGLGVPIDATAVDVALPRSAIEVDYAAVLADLAVATPDRCMDRIDQVNAVLRDYAPDFSSTLQRWVVDQRESISDELLARLVPLLVETRQRGEWVVTERVARAIRRVSPLHEEATLALAEAMCAAGDKAHAIQVLDEYLNDAGEDEPTMRLPAELMRRRMSIPADTNGTAGQSVQFVGRREHLQRFQAFFAEAAAGRGAAILYCGPAGIGKTRLLEECTAFASTVGRAQVVRARCQAGDALRPLSGLTDVVQKLLETPGAAGCEPATLRLLTQLGEIGELGGGDPERSGNGHHTSQVRRDDVRDAVLDLLAAVSHETRLVVQIDDFQWSDSTLAWLWDSVLPHAKSQRILWCFAARVEQPADSEMLFSPRIRPLISNEWLLGLEARDARTLLDSLLTNGRSTTSASVRETLLERGGGIPLVLLELVRHWKSVGDLASVPASLAALMEARLARLTPAARRTLQVSALLGTFSTLERLEQVLQLPRADFVDALAQLESAGILTSDRAGVIHGHVLWAEAALAHVEPSVVRVLHRHVAEEFDRELEGTPAPAILWESARHWEAGGQVDRATAAIVRGAEHLARNGLYLEAADAYERAITQSDDAKKKRTYVRRRIDLFRLCGLWSPIPQEIDRYARLSKESDATYDQHNELEPMRRHALYQTVGPSDALAEQALACARDLHATVSHRIQAVHDCVRYGMERERHDVIEHGYGILASLTPATPDDRQPYALSDVMYNLLMGDQRKAVVVAREWQAYERERGDAYRMCWSSRTAAFASMMVGDLTGARDAYLESIRIARESRLWLMLYSAHELLVGMMIEYDEPHAARERLELAWAECAGFANQVPNVLLTFAMHRAELALEEQNGAEALRHVPTGPFQAGARQMRVMESQIRLGANMLMHPPRGGGPEARALADQLARHFDLPMFGLGHFAATYAEYLDMYHGPSATDAFVRRFIATVWRELLPPRRLAPFVERIRQSSRGAASATLHTASLAASGAL